MWVGRSRIGIAICLSVVPLGFVACQATNPASTLTTGGANDAAVGATADGADASLTEAAAPDATHDSAGPADAAWCKVPYNCPDSAGWDASPPQKDGATPANPDATVAGFCPAALIAFDSHSLKATGPTQAFANAYNAALANAPFGPFVIEIAGSNGTATTNFFATFAGAITTSSTKADTTEPGGSYPYLLSQPSPLVGITIARAEKPFHLAFTRNSDPAGDITVAGVELKATMDDAGCASMQKVTATLYIAQSQSNVPLGGSTLGQLLGTTNATLSSGPGWAVPLSGTSAEILLQ
jgi:hypothetical protein